MTSPLYCVRFSFELFIYLKIMLGIFIVIGLIIAVTYALNHFTNKKNKN
ncbi:MAG: hypothetical protein IKD14_00080 [Clostridia bacterium]|nr:hypothetical protein [Clostridia bacterium]